VATRRGRIEDWARPVLLASVAFAFFADRYWTLEYREDSAVLRYGLRMVHSEPGGSVETYASARERLREYFELHPMDWIGCTPRDPDLVTRDHLARFDDVERGARTLTAALIGGVGVVLVSLALRARRRAAHLLLFGCSLANIVALGLFLDSLNTRYAWFRAHDIAGFEAVYERCGPTAASYALIAVWCAVAAALVLSWVNLPRAADRR
jgi:hypothetical protein